MTHPQHITLDDPIAIAIPPGCGRDRKLALIERVMRGGKPRAVRVRPRRPTLASVAKQASQAAIQVARYEVRPDGTVVVVTGAPESSTEPNPWLADLNKVRQ